MLKKRREHEEVLFQTALENALGKKSLDFYIKKINELHNSADVIRFQLIVQARPPRIFIIL